MREIHKYITDSVKSRFFSKIDSTGSCSLWTGARQKGMAYGAFKLNGTVYPAHRVMFAIAHGRDPEGLVMHTCDNPWCVDIKHLKEGTYKDNTQDCIRKGRRNFWKIRGERNGNSKITDDQVNRIHKLYKQGFSGYKIAEMFACTPQAVYLILSGQRRAQPTVPLDNIPNSR